MIWHILCVMPYLEYTYIYGAVPSIGYFDTVTRILQLLVKNNDYKLEPVATAWTKQQDTQWAKEKERECTPKSKGM